MSQIIYADHAATTPLAPDVLAAMMPYLTQYYGNASSPHAMGQASQIAVDRARDDVAKVLGCTSAEVVFTGGGCDSCWDGNCREGTRTIKRIHPDGCELTTGCEGNRCESARTSERVIPD